MTHPTTLLRDAAIAGLLLAGAGMWWSYEFGAQVAAGALGALLNMFFLVRTVQAAGTFAFYPRLLVAHVVGGVSLIVLVAKLDPAPVLVGSCAAILALGVRGFAGLLAPPPENA